MKRLISIVLLLIPISVYATTPKIIPSKDMTYLGAFRLPSPPRGYTYHQGDSAGGGRRGLEYLPTDGSLLILVNTSKQNFYKKLMKVSTPAMNTLSKSKVFSDLPLSTLLHSPVDIAVDPWGRSAQSGLNPSKPFSFLGDIHYLPAKGSQTTGKLYWSVYGSYVDSCCPFTLVNGQFGWAETDLDNLNQKGMWAFTTGCPLYANCCAVSGKYLFHAPQDWADTYTSGRSLLQGYTRTGGNSGGPVIYAFAPWLSCGGSPINCDANPPPDARDGATPTGVCSDTRPTLTNTLPYTILLQYNLAPSGGSTPTHVVKDRSMLDTVTSARWLVLGDKRAIVFNGQRCLRNWATNDWSYPANYYPGAVISGDNEGYHADPCTEILWFYYQDDITAVVRGTKQRYDPQPYKRVELRPFMLSASAGYGIGGMAYDETNQYLFIEQTLNSTQDVIHVFQLSDSGKSTLDTTPPSGPLLSLVSASKSSVNFSWAAVSDNSGLPVVYRIYRNNRPIAIQTGTTYTDSYLSYYPAPVEYRVDAVDFEGNISSGNTVSIDASNGGNAPLNIFIPIQSSFSAHETSTVRFHPDGSTTFTPTIKGGTPPYTWSIADFPPGVSINPATGQLSGTPASSTYGGKIIVHDSASPANYARRKTSIGKRASDLDFDGVSETGINDLNMNVTPGMTYSQPAPIGLTVSNSTTSSVSLTWTAAADRTDHTWWQDHGVGYTRALQNGLDITYEVYHGTKSGTYTESLYVGRATTHTMSGLATNTTHYFAVKAIDFYGLNSHFSNEVSHKFGKPPVPSRLNGQAYGAYYAEGLDESASVVQTSDGGVIIVGPTWSYAWNFYPGAEVVRIMMLKTDSSGVEQWRKIIGPEAYNITVKQNSTLSWVPRQVILSGTSPIIVGYRGTSGTQGINGFLMKFDSSGNLIWDRDFNNASYPTKNDLLFDAVERKGGGFAAVGQGWSGAQTGFWLLLTDANGQNSASIYYHYVSKGWATGRRIRKTSDGGYIMAGYTTTGNVLDEDYYVVKVSSDGTPQWQQKYDNSGRRDIATGIEEDASGNFWVFGRSQSPTQKNTKIWIIKLSNSGVLQSSYTLGDDVSSHVYVARKSVKLSNGNFLIVGYTNVSSSTGYHGYVAEINASGTVIKSATIGATTGRTEEYLMGVKISNDGNYYHVIGTDNGSFSTAYDFWYLKLLASDLSVKNFTSCNSKVIFFYDKDLDGYGNNYQWSPATGGACFAMPGYVLTHNDPDDSNPSVTPR